MNVPFMGLKRIDSAIDQTIVAAILKVHDNRNFIQGDEKKAFEEAFAAYCGVAHCIGVDNGTSGLELSLRALEIGRGDEVIAPANTFYATVYAIYRSGAKPVLVDVLPGTYNMDPEQVQRVVSRNTKAIMPVHLYGQPADMRELQVIAQRDGLKIVEDACQAHGAEYEGTRCGSIGDIAAFSFYPAKNLGADGDGGAVVTNNDALATKVRSMQDYGQPPGRKYHHIELGGNHRLDTLQAAVLGVKLPHLDQWNGQRRAVAGLYRELLTDVPGITLPTEAPDRTHVYHLFVIQVSDRDGLQRHLKQEGVDTGIHYPIPVHMAPAFHFLGYKHGDFPVTEHAADHILSLPMFPELKRDEVEYVAKTLRDFAEGR